MAKQKNANIQDSKKAPLGGQPGYGGITEGNVGADIAGQPIPGGPEQNDTGYSGGSSGKSESGDAPSLLDREEGSMAGQGGRSDIGESMPGDESVPENVPSVGATEHQQPLRQGESAGSREGGVAGSGGSVDASQPIRQGESGASHQGAVANPSNAYTGTPRKDQH